MPRVVPSDVLATIDRLFPFAATEVDDGRAKSLGPSWSARLSALLALVDEIPRELLRLDGSEYATLITAVEAIRDILAMWRLPAPADGSFYSMGDIKGLPPVSPVTLIRLALAKCPDELPAPSTIDLPFIKDKRFRESIRLDMSAANS
jgi:hypothetical protein